MIPQYNVIHGRIIDLQIHSLCCLLLFTFNIYYTIYCTIYYTIYDTTYYVLLLWLLLGTLNTVTLNSPPEAVHKRGPDLQIYVPIIALPLMLHLDILRHLHSHSFYSKPKYSKKKTHNILHFVHLFPGILYLYYVTRYLTTKLLSNWKLTHGNLLQRTWAKGLASYLRSR